MSQLDQSLISELKQLIKKKDIYRPVTLDNILAGEMGYTTMQCRILRIRECDEIPKSWTYLSSANNKQKQYKYGNFFKFIFLGDCSSGKVCVIRIKSRSEANVVLQRESFLCLGCWTTVIEAFYDNEKLSKRGIFIPVVSTQYPLLEIDNPSDCALPPSLSGFPLLRSASLAEGSMSMFWFTLPSISIYRARYLCNTCPRVFCDRTTSLGYVGSSTRTVCRICSASMHSESKYSIMMDMGFMVDGITTRTTVSGRKLCSLFIEQSLVDVSWEEYSTKVNNRLQQLVTTTRDIINIINSSPTAYWMICGWVMYGQTVNTTGETVVSDFKKAHIVDLVPYMSPETTSEVECKKIKSDPIEIPRPPSTSSNELDNVES